MNDVLQNVLLASFHGSVVITAVLLLRLLLKQTPKKYLCFLWMLAFLRLMMPFEIQSAMSLQPEPKTMATMQQIVGQPVDMLPMPSPVDLPEPETERTENVTHSMAPAEQELEEATVLEPETITVTPSFDWNMA